MADAATPPSDADTVQPIDLCASADLAERGSAHLFDLLEFGLPAIGFVLRFDGQVVGYLNRCAHVPTELDWQPGQFLDSQRSWIICSIHGALYRPQDGRCVAGPCVGRALKPLRVAERDGRVYWYPSDHFTPSAGA
jgi:nitrite reductase/ring-hydroxylating ferredoxin subunit